MRVNYWERTKPRPKSAVGHIQTNEEYYKVIKNDLASRLCRIERLKLLETEKAYNEDNTDHCIKSCAKDYQKRLAFIQEKLDEVKIEPGQLTILEII